MAWQGFGYRWLHDLIGIGATVEHYGPLNPLRPDFHLTSLDQRVRLFIAIVDAIHHQGEGLQTLAYFHADGQRIGLLLTKAEIIHLTDVARLVAWLRPAGWVALSMALFGTAWVCVRGQRLPGRRLFGVFISAICLVAAVLWVFGAEAVFYWLHTVIFPAGHQWFFYYEESLMSMMMQAPDLFGAIALIWALLTVAIISIWSQAFRRS